MIPQNASIEEARLQLTSKNASEYTQTSTQIALSKLDDAEQTKNCRFKGTSTYADTAVVKWNMSQFYTEETYRSPDISSLVRYAINSDTWEEGKDIILVLKNKLKTTVAHQRKIHYNNTKLSISYRKMQSEYNLSLSQISCH